MALGCLRMSGLLTDALAGRASEAERLELESHLAGCASCRDQHRALGPVRSLKGWEPPALTTPARERVRQALLASVPVAAVPRASRGWLIGLAAAAAAGALLWWGWPHAGHPAALASGDLQGLAADARAVPDGARLSSRAGGRVTLDGPDVALAPGSEAIWHAGARTVELIRGAVTVDVDPGQGRHFRVATARFTVEVVGTRFVVDLAGVRTLRGKVRVTRADGALVGLVSAGESWTVPAPAPAPAARAPAAPPPSAPAESAPSAALPHSAAHKPDPAAEKPVDRLTAARRALTAGHGDAARSLLRPLLAGPRGIAVEARALMAESFLVEARYTDAIESYRAVARDFPATAQADSALFAIAELEAETGSAADARAALERYLARYPQGRFAREARERLGRLGPGR